MKFSVVIPLYNKEAHIEGAIQSVHAQHHPSFEVIVVDDGSTDKSLQAAKAFEKSRVKVISKENGGTASARNAGIKAAKGDYICFLDADDFWLPGFLGQMDALISHYPEAGIYCTAYQFQRKAERYHPGYHGLPKNEKIFLVPNYFESVLHGEQIVTASSACIPKRVIDDVGPFDNTMRRTEDQEMWNRIALKYRVAFDSDVAAIYVQDAANMKTRYVPKQEIEYAAKLQQQLDNGHVPPEKELWAKKIIAANLIGAAATNLLAGEEATAQKFLSDPRTADFPERKKKWVRMMMMPLPLRKLLYGMYRKRRNQR